jgi:hypothetical protein
VLFLRVLEARSAPSAYASPWHRQGINPTPTLITAFLALFAVTILVPVVFHGRPFHRWLAGGLAVMPLWLFALTALDLL